MYKYYRVNYLYYQHGNAPEAGLVLYYTSGNFDLNEAKKLIRQQLNNPAAVVTIAGSNQISKEDYRNLTGSLPLGEI